MLQILIRIFGSAGDLPYSEALYACAAVIIVLGFAFILKCIGRIFEI